MSTRLLGLTLAVALAVAGLAHAQTARPGGPFTRITFGSNSGPKILSGTGSPEGAQAYCVGSVWLRTDGGTSSAVYFKETGACTSAGWVAAGGGAGGGGGGSATVVHKTADETVTSSTTLQNDDHLTFAIAASETWQVTYHLYLDAVTAADLKIALAVPAGATGTWGAVRLVSSAAGTSADLESVAAANVTTPLVLGGAGAGSILYVQATAYIVNSTTAGTVVLQWAQNTSDATGSILKQHSHLVAQPVSGVGQVTSYPSTSDGRLTTESGVPVSVSDRTAQATIYFTPYQGNRIALYNGANWVLYTFTERSLALSGLTSGKPYDVFLYDNAGTLTLELSAAWTNDTTRADAVTVQDGVWVKSSATTRRLLGTVYTTATTTTEDSLAKRYVWNLYNQVARSMSAVDTTDSWSYTTATWRQARATATNQVDYVVGIVGQSLSANVIGPVRLESNTATLAGLAVGVDSTTTPSGLVGAGFKAATGATYVTLSGLYVGNPGIGRHSFVWLERGATAGTSTFYGDNGGDGTQSGLNATVWN